MILLLYPKTLPAGSFPLKLSNPGGVRRGCGEIDLLLNPIYLRALPDAEHQAGIMRGKISSSAHFEKGTFQLARLPSNKGPYRIWTYPRADALDAEPVDMVANVICPTNVGKPRQSWRLEMGNLAQHLPRDPWRHDLRLLRAWAEVW